MEHPKVLQVRIDVRLIRELRILAAVHGRSVREELEAAVTVAIDQARAAGELP